MCRAPLVQRIYHPSWLYERLEIACESSPTIAFGMSSRLGCRGRPCDGTQKRLLASYQRGSVQVSKFQARRHWSRPFRAMSCLCGAAFHSVASTEKRLNMKRFREKKSSRLVQCAVAFVFKKHWRSLFRFLQRLLPQPQCLYSQIPRKGANKSPPAKVVDHSDAYDSSKRLRLEFPT